jgi:hypothetical protein
MILSYFFFFRRIGIPEFQQIEVRIPIAGSGPTIPLRLSTIRLEGQPISVKVGGLGAIQEWITGSVAIRIAGAVAIRISGGEVGLGIAGGGTLTIRIAGLAKIRIGLADA